MNVFVFVSPPHVVVVNLTFDREVPTGTKLAWPLGGDKGSWKLSGGCKGSCRPRGRDVRTSLPGPGGTRKHSQGTTDTEERWHLGFLEPDFFFFAPASFLSEPYFWPFPQTTLKGRAIVSPLN